MIGGKKQGWPSGEVERLRKSRGFNLKSYKGISEIRILRNCTEPETGKRILEYAINPIKLQKELF